MDQSINQTQEFATEQVNSASKQAIQHLEIIADSGKWKGNETGAGGRNDEPVLILALLRPSSTDASLDLGPSPSSAQKVTTGLRTEVLEWF